MGWLDDTADWFKRTNTAMDVWFYSTVDKVLTGNVTGRSTAQHAEDLSRSRPDLQGTSQTGLEHAVSRDSHDRTRDGVKTLERTEVVMRKGTIITANLLLPGSGAAVSAAADSALGRMDYDTGRIREVGLGEMAVNAFSSATVTGAAIDGGLEVAGTFNGSGGSNQPQQSGQTTQPGNRRHGTGSTQSQDQSSGMGYGIMGALIGGGIGLMTGGFTSLTGILVTIGLALSGYALASNFSGDKGGRPASVDVAAPTTPTGNRQSQHTYVPTLEVGAPTNVVAPGHNQNAVLNR